MNTVIRPYAKAIVGAIVAFLGQLVVAMNDSSQAGSSVTGQEWLQAIIVGLVSLGVVFAVPNDDPLGVKQGQSVRPSVMSSANYQKGEGVIYILVWVLAIIVIVYAILLLLGRL